MILHAKSVQRAYVDLHLYKRNFFQNGILHKQYGTLFYSRTKFHPETWKDRNSPLSCRRAAVNPLTVVVCTYPTTQLTIRSPLIQYSFASITSDTMLVTFSYSTRLAVSSPFARARWTSSRMRTRAAVALVDIGSASKSRAEETWKNNRETRNGPG